MFRSAAHKRAAGTNAGQGLPGDPFTPKFTFKSSTPSAGAHPDLTFTMRKMRGHCAGWKDDTPQFTCNPEGEHKYKGEDEADHEVRALATPRASTCSRI